MILHARKALQELQEVNTLKDESPKLHAEIARLRQELALKESTVANIQSQIQQQNISHFSMVDALQQELAKKDSIISTLYGNTLSKKVTIKKSDATTQTDVEEVLECSTQTEFVTPMIQVAAAPYKTSPLPSLFSEVDSSEVLKLCDYTDMLGVISNDSFFSEVTD